MNVKATTELIFGDAAMLAGVFIALAGLVALPMPILAAILPVSIFPIASIGLYPMFIVTLRRAIQVFISSVLRWGACCHFATIGAIKTNWLNIAAVIRSKASGMVARLRAILFAVFTVNIFVFFAAMLALFDGWFCAAVCHSFRIGKSAIVRTVLSTGMLTTSIKNGRWGNGELFTASLTRQLDWHQKILPTKDGRLVVTGWGRPAVGSRLFETVHEAVSSPCGIIPQRG